MTTAEDSFEDDRPLRAAPQDLVLDLEGYEGPIDVLLTLARDQKVDLTRISILKLADQYLAFIVEARRLRLEIAADYLVMAAWLVYLKSRLLLPEQEEPGEPTGPELAEALTFQLRRLEAMQESGAKLMARPRLGRDVFARGAPEGVEIVQVPTYSITLFELLKAYGENRRRSTSQTFEIKPMALFDIKSALERLSGLVGDTFNWQSLFALLPEGLQEPVVQRSAVASTLGAALELVRTGQLELRQSGHFGPIFVRRGDAKGSPETADSQ